MVYVIAMDGQPLMPTERHGKVKHLLKDGKAKVVKRCPFTIQLLYETPHYVQPVSLGVKAGSEKIGFSATTSDKELLAEEVELRTDVVKNISTRREFRRARRNRKTRYRKPRFKNRTHGKKGRLAPSVEQKINTHIQCVKDICETIPVSKIVVECAAFDIQKIKNPDISGKEYQQGEQAGFWNVREYVLFRDGHQCQHCHGKSGDKILNVHHIESRKTGGDAPGNLITLCETCHHAYHQGKIKLDIKREPSFRDAAFMGIMRWTLYNRLKDMFPNVEMTFGYITKNVRIKNGLSKSRITDARCISGNPCAKPCQETFYCKAVRRHNRQIHKATINKGGTRKRNQAPKYVYGYQLFDKVLCEGEEAFIFARRTSGYFDVRKLDGTKINAEISRKKLKLLETRKTLLTEKRSGSPPTP